MGEMGVLGDVLEEVFDEMSGRSTAKWGIALVAFLVGAAVAMAIVRRRGSRADLNAEQSEAAQIPA